MSVTFAGKINLLSGHYQDIVIREKAKNNFFIKITPNKFYHVRELDKSYHHLTYDNLSDSEKINQVIDSYFYHNTIFMIANSGRVKKHTGEYKALNAYPTIINGYQSTARALYFKVADEKLAEVLNKAITKYQEDRIRHSDQILKCKVIVVDLSSQITSYIIKEDEAYLTLFSNLDKECNKHPSNPEISFLKMLLINFIKKHGKHISYESEKIILYSEDYLKRLEIEASLFSYLLQAENEVYFMNQEQCYNMTIEEYLCLLKPRK